MKPLTEYKRLGEILVERGYATQEQMSLALSEQHRTRLRIGEVVVLLGIADDWAIATCLAEQFDVPLADFDSLQPKQAALGLLSAEFALERLVLPIEDDGERLNCIVTDPLDFALTDQLEASLQRRLSLTLAPPSALREAIRKWYGLQAHDKSAPKRPRKRAKVKRQSDREALLEVLERKLAA